MGISCFSLVPPVPSTFQDGTKYKKAYIFVSKMGVMDEGNEVTHSILYKLSRKKNFQKTI